MFKVNLFDAQLRKQYYSILSIIGLICSFVFIFVEIPAQCKVFYSLLFLLMLILVYILLWILANFSKAAKIQINNSIVEVITGDIFKEKDLKAIPFNEYFDTQVDNKIIAKTSLNGIYINNIIKEIDKLDEAIEMDAHLKDNIIDKNLERGLGKLNRYKLGTIFEYDDYLLTAFARFNNQNKAILSISEYINFLINFWNEVDIIYAGRTIVVPLFGSGITRFKEYNMITDQELLELLIWSFKVSRIKFTYPSKVTIMIHEDKKDKINFYKIRRGEYEL